MIDNITSQSLFIEKSSIKTITIDELTNNNGTILQDDSGNMLINPIDLGDTELGKLVSYRDSVGKLLIQNTTTGQWGMYHEGDNVDIPIDFVNGLRYYTGAREIKLTNFTGNKFHANLKGLNVFKAYLNNVEISEFSQEEDYVEILGKARYSLDTNINSLTLIVYSERGITIGGYVVRYNEKTSTTKIERVPLIEGGATIEYVGYDKIFVLDDALSLEYFNNDNVTEVQSYDEMSMSETVELTKINKGFRSKTKNIITGFSGKIDISTFDNNEEKEVSSFVRRKEFRVWLVNEYFKRIRIFNNCSIADGMNMTEGKEKNIKRFSIDFSNYIEMRLDENNELEFLYNSRDKGE